MEKIKKNVGMCVVAIAIVSVQGCKSIGDVKDSLSTVGESVSGAWEDMGASGQGAAVLGSAAAIGCGVTMGAEAAVLCAMGAGVIGGLIGNEIEKTQEDYESKYAFLDSRIKITDDLIKSEDEKTKEIAVYTKNTKKSIKILKKKIKRSGKGKEELTQIRDEAKDVYNKHEKEYKASLRHVEIVKKILKNKEYTNEKNRKILVTKLSYLERKNMSYKVENKKLLREISLIG